MGNKGAVVMLSDGSGIEVTERVPFSPADEGYTGIVQSVLTVFDDEDFEPIAICEAHFRSLGKDFGGLCEDGQLGLDEFVSESLDGTDVLPYADTLLLSKGICQRARSVGELEVLIGAHEFSGYWLFARRFVDGKEVESEMTLGTADLFSLIDFGDFAPYTRSDHAIRYPERWGMGTGRILQLSDRLAI